MTNDPKYWAFISYSHTDETWAKWLHQRLETFPVPRTLVGRPAERGDTVPRRIAPVFRDRDELPGASRLEDNIRDALAGSRYLIVICSPRSAVSRWVNEEVIAFKTLGRADRILCLIIDGEPNATDKPDCGLLECFPPAIRHVVHPDGSLSSEREEPIAADARLGKDGKSDALLKLVAGVLGVGFDDLKRREERRRRRMRMLWSLAATVLLAAAGWAGHRIWEEQRRANREAAIARAMNDFLIYDLLLKAGSEAQADTQLSVDPNLTVREALERAAARIGDRFKNEPLTEASIRTVIGEAFRQVGDYSRSIEHLEKAWRLREAGLGVDHPHTLTSVNNLGFLLSAKGNHRDAEPLYRRALV